MVDITTVAVSVGTTLTIQGVYYIAIQFPYQLHKDKAKLAELSLRESGIHAISRRTMLELRLAAKVFDDWKKHLLELQNQDEPSDYSYFLGALPLISLQLGRLAGVILVDDKSGVGEQVADLLELLQAARRISKEIAAAGSISPETLASELWEISIIEGTMTSRLEQLQRRETLRQGQIRFEVANVTADMKNNLRRFRSAIAFTSLAGFLASYLFLNLFFDHFGPHFIHRKLIVLLLLFLAVCLTQAIISHFVKSAYKDADVHLIENLGEQLEGDEQSRPEMKSDTSSS